MLTKGAIGNLINRYRAVLKKCHLINTFGSLAVASMLVMGGAGVAEATITDLYIGKSGGSSSGDFFKLDVQKSSVTVTFDNDSTTSQEIASAGASGMVYVGPDGSIDTSAPTGLKQLSPNSDISTNTNVIVAPTGTTYKDVENTTPGTAQETLDAKAYENQIVDVIKNKYTADLKENIVNATITDAMVENYVIQNKDAELKEEKDELQKIAVSETIQKAKDSGDYKTKYNSELETAKESDAYTNAYNDAYNTSKNTDEYKKAAQKLEDFKSSNDYTSAVNAAYNIALSSSDTYKDKYNELKASLSGLDKFNPIKLAQIAGQALDYAKANARADEKEAAQTKAEADCEYLLATLKKTLEDIAEAYATAEANKTAEEIATNNTDAYYTEQAIGEKTDSQWNADAVDSYLSDVTNKDEATTAVKENIRDNISDDQLKAEAEKLYADKLEKNEITVTKTYTGKQYDGLSSGASVTATLENKDNGGKDLYQANSVKVEGNPAGSKGTLTNKTQLDVTTSVTINKNGTFNNEGKLTVGDNDNSGKRTASGNIDITDGAFNNKANAFVDIDGSVTVAGSGTFTNDGTVKADSGIAVSGGQFTNNSTGSVTVGSGIAVSGNGQFTNAGSLAAADGTLDLSLSDNGTFSNSADGLAVENVTFTDGGTYTNTGANNTIGNLTGSGTALNVAGGSVDVDKANATLGSVTVSGSGELTLGSWETKDDTLNVGKVTVSNGTVTNYDTINATGSKSDATAFQIGQNGTVKNHHTINVGTSADPADFVISDGTLTNAALTDDKGKTIRENGKIVAGAVHATGNVTVTNGTVTNDYNTSQITAGKNINITDSTVVNKGTISASSTAEGTGKITIDGGKYTSNATGILNAGNTIEVKGNSTFTNAGTVTAGKGISFTDSTVNTTGDITATTGNVTVSGGSFVNKGKVEATKGDITVSGGIFDNRLTGSLVAGNDISISTSNKVFGNGGTLTAGNSVTFDNSTITNTGTITAENGDINIKGVFTNTVGGILKAGDAIDVDIADNGEFVNKGTVNTTNIALHSGTLDNIGSINATGTITVESTFENIGTVTGNADLVVKNGASFSNTSNEFYTGNASFDEVTIDNGGSYVNTAGTTTVNALHAGKSIIGSLSSAGGSLTVSGGNFVAGTSDAHLESLAMSGDANVTVNGGSLKLDDVNITGGTFNASNTQVQFDSPTQRDDKTLANAKIELSSENGVSISNLISNLSKLDLGNLASSLGELLTADGLLSWGDTSLNDTSVTADNALAGFVGDVTLDKDSSLTAKNGAVAAVLLGGLTSNGGDITIEKGTETDKASTLAVTGNTSLKNGATLGVENSLALLAGSTTLEGSSINVKGDEVSLNFNELEGLDLSKPETLAKLLDSSILVSLGGTDLQTGSTVTVDKGVAVFTGKDAVPGLKMAGTSSLTAQDGALVGVIGDLASTGSDITVTDEPSAAVLDADDKDGALSTLLVTGRTDLTDGANLNVKNSLAILTGGTSLDGSSISVKGDANSLDFSELDNLDFSKPETLTKALNSSILAALNGTELKKGSSVTVDKGIAVFTGKTEKVEQTDANGNNVMVDKVTPGLNLNDSSFTAQNGALVGVFNGLTSTGSYITVTNKDASGTAGSKSTLFVSGDTSMTGGKLDVADSLALLTGSASMDSTKLSVKGTDSIGINTDNVEGAFSNGLDPNALLGLFNGASLGVFGENGMTMTGNSSLEAENAIAIVTGDLTANFDAKTADPNLSVNKSLLYVGEDTALTNATAKVDSSVVALGGNAIVGGLSKIFEKAQGLGNGKVDLSKIDAETINGLLYAVATHNSTSLTNSSLDVDNSLVAAVGKLTADNGSAIDLASSGLLLGGDAELNGAALKLDKSAFAMGGGLTIGEGSAVTASNSGLVVGDQLNATNRDASFEKSLLYVGDATTLTNSDLTLNSSVAVLGGDVVADATAAAAFKVMNKMAQVDFANLTDPEYVKEALKIYGDLALDKLTDLKPEDVAAYLAAHKSDTTLNNSALTLNKADGAAIGSTAVVFGDLTMNGASSAALIGSSLLVLDDIHAGKSSLTAKDGSLVAMTGDLTATAGNAITVTDKSGLVVGDNFKVTGRDGNKVEKSALYVGDNTTLTNAPLTLSSSVAVLGGDMATDALAGLALDVIKNNDLTVEKLSNLTAQQAFSNIAEAFEGKLDNKTPEQIAKYISDNTRDTTLTDSALTLNKADGEALGSTVAAFGNLTATNSNIGVQGSNLLVLGDTTIDNPSALSVTDKSVMAMGGSLTVGSAASTFAARTTPAPLTVKDSVLAVGDILDVTGRAVEVSKSALYVGDQTNLNNAPLTLTDSVAVFGGDVLADPALGSVWTSVQDADLSKVELSTDIVERGFKKILKDIDDKLDTVDGQDVIDYLAANMRDVTLSGNSELTATNSTIAAFGNLDMQGQNAVELEKSQLFLLGSANINKESTLSAKDGSMVAVGNMLNASGNVTTEESVLFVGNGTNITDASFDADKTLAILGGGEAAEVFADTVYDALKEAVSKLNAGETLSADAIKAILVNNLPTKAELKAIVTDGGKTSLKGATANVDGSIVAVLGDLEAQKNDANKSTIALGSSAMGVAGNATLTDTDATAANGSTLFVGKNTSLTDSSLSADGSMAVLGGGNFVEHLADIATRSNGNISVDYANLTASLRAKYGSLRNALATVLHDSANTTLTGSELSATSKSIVAVVGDLTAKKNAADDGSSITATDSSLFVGGDTNLTGSTLTASGNAANMVAMAGSLKANASTASVTGSSMFVGNNANLTSGSSLVLNGSMTMIGGGEVLEEMAAGIYDDIRDAVSQLANGTQLSADDIKAIVVNNLPGAADLKQLVTEGGHATITDSTFSATNNSLVAVLGDLTATDSDKDDIAEVALSSSAMGVAGSATLTDADATATGSALFVGKNTTLVDSSLTADGSVAVLGGGEAVEQMAAALIDRTADGNISVSFDNLAANLQQKYGSLKKALAGILDKSADTTLSDGSKLEAANGSVVAVMGDLTASSKSSVAANASSLFVGGDTSLSGNSTLTANGNAANMVAMAGSLNADASTVTTMGSSLFVGNDTELENGSSLTTDGSVAVLGGGEVVERIAQKLYAAAKDAKNGIEEVINDPSKLSLDALVAFVKDNLPTVAEVKKDLTKGGDTTLSGGSTFNATNGSTVTVLGELKVNDKSSVDNYASTMVLMNGLSGDTDSSVTNTGTFTVENGTVSNFAGTFNQNAGETIINQGLKDTLDPDGDNGTDSFFGNREEGTVNLNGGKLVADADKALYTGSWGTVNVDGVDHKLLNLPAYIPHTPDTDPNNLVANNLNTRNGSELWLDLEKGYYTATDYLRIQNELNADSTDTTGAKLVFFNGNLLMQEGDRILAGGTVVDPNAEEKTLIVNNFSNGLYENMTVIAGAGVSVEDAFTKPVHSASSILGDVTDTTAHSKFVADVNNMLVIVDQTDVNQKAFKGNIVFDGTLPKDNDTATHNVTAQGLAIGDGSNIALTNGANLTLAGTHTNGVFVDAEHKALKNLVDVAIDDSSSLTVGLGSKVEDAIYKATFGEVAVAGEHTLAGSGETTKAEVSYTTLTVADSGKFTAKYSHITADNIYSNGEFKAMSSSIDGSLNVTGGNAALSKSSVNGITAVTGGTLTAKNASDLSNLDVSQTGKAYVTDSTVGKLGVGDGGYAELGKTDVTVAASVANGALVAKKSTLANLTVSGTKGEAALESSTVSGDTTVLSGKLTALSKSALASLSVEDGEAIVDSSEVIGATTVTGGKFTAQNSSTLASLAVDGGTATVTDSLVNELDTVNGKLTMERGTLADNDITVAGTASFDSVAAEALKKITASGSLDLENMALALDNLTVSGDVKITGSEVSVAMLSTSGGSIFVDPSTLTVQALDGDGDGADDGILNSALMVGEGSTVSLGDVSAIGSMKNALMIGAGKSITLGDNGALLVDPNAVEGKVTEPGAGEVVFKSGSTLAVADASQFDLRANPEAKAAISGADIVKVDSGAKLYLNKVAANQSYFIADYTNADDTNVAGWQQKSKEINGIDSDGDDVIISRVLDALTKVEDGKVTIVTSEAVTSNFMTEALPKNALHELAEEAADVYADEAGKQFLSRAADSTYMPSEDDAISAINEVTRAAVTAGVQNTALRVSDMAARTVIDHMSLAQHDGSKAIHADGVDFWAAPMYGNLFTSGMVTADSSVRGQFGGLALGMDMESQQILGGKVRVGAALNGGGGQSTAKGNVTSVSNDYNFGGVNVYAGWNKGAFNVIGSIGYGFADHKVDMSLPGSMQMGSAKTDIDTTAVTAELRAEYQFKTSHVDVLPHAGIRYTSLQTDAHDLTVNGSVLNTVKSDTQNIVQFPIGVTFTKDFEANGWNVKPMADISVIPSAGEKDAHTKVNFSGMDAWDSVNTRIMDSTSWSGTVGVQAEKGNFSLGLNYGVQASSNETDQNIQLKLGWKF